MASPLVPDASEPPALVDLACGLDHTLALDVDGRVWAAGRNTDGQLGVPTSGPSSGPVLHHVPLPLPARSIAAGGDVSGAVLANGDVYLWGNDEYGQVLTGERLFAVGEPRHATKLPAHVASLALGVHHGVAVTDDGMAFTWGWGGTPIDSLADAERVSVGVTHLESLSDVHTAAAGDHVSVFVTGSSHMHAYGLWGSAAHWETPTGELVLADQRTPIALADVAARIDDGAVWQNLILGDGHGFATFATPSAARS